MASNILTLEGKTIEEGVLETLEEIVELAEMGQKEARLALEDELSRMFDQAKAARQTSGIEPIWDYCSAILNDEDGFSDGHDGAVKANWYKPSSPDGKPMMKSRAAKGGGRSDAIINITEAVVLFAGWAAKEMAIPNNGDFWALKETPVGRAAQLAEHLAANGVLPKDAESMLAFVAQGEEQAIAEAQARTSDMFKESVNDLESLAVSTFDDSAGMGTAVVCGPLPLEKDGVTRPSWYTVSVDRLWPDPACGADIRNGSFIFEGPWPQSARELRALRERTEEGWIPEALNEILENENKDPAYDFYYFYGEVPKKCACPVMRVDEPDNDSASHTWISATICDKKVVRIGAMVLDGAIPYRVQKFAKFKTKRNEHWEEYWAGKPIAWKIRSPQKSLNIDWRSLDDNTQLSAVPQRIWWKGILEPHNGRYEWAPGKDWFVATKSYSQEALKEVQHAFMTIDIPCHLEEIRQNIPMALQMIAPITGLDDVVRGISQGTQVGTAQIQLNAGSHLAKRTTFYWQQLFEGMVRDAIRWQQKFEGLDVTPQVELIPPPTQVVRDVQANSLVNFLSLAMNPAYGQDPKLLAESYLQSNQFDPRRTALTPERAQEISALNTPPPDEKAQAAVQSADLRAQSNVEAARVDAEAKTTQTMVKAEDAARDRAHDIQMLILKYKLELVNYAQQRGIDVQTAAAELEAINIPMEGVKAVLAQDLEEKQAKAEPKKEETNG